MPHTYSRGHHEKIFLFSLQLLGQHHRSYFLWVTDDSGLIDDKAFLGINLQERRRFWLRTVSRLSTLLLPLT